MSSTHASGLHIEDTVLGKGPNATLIFKVKLPAIS
jgi:hypothetical protein